MIKNNNKGFTLIELLVVVLIIGILAAMAMPQYFKAVERSRMTEAVTLLGNIAQSQQRKYLQINKYTTNYDGLDVAPKGATKSTYYTKGNPTTGANGNGFVVSLVGTTFADGIATADRTNGTGTDGTGTAAAKGKKDGLQYDYTLTRYYASNDTTCTGNNDNGALLCADFCGIDTLAAKNSCCSDGRSSGGCGTPSSSMTGGEKAAK